MLKLTERIPLPNNHVNKGEKDERGDEVDILLPTREVMHLIFIAQSQITIRYSLLFLRTWKLE